MLPEVEGAKDVQTRDTDGDAPGSTVTASTREKTILVIVAGAELFTGKNLIVMAWAERKIATSRLLRNWVLVYAGNFVGAFATDLVVHWSGVLGLDDGGVARTAAEIAATKVQLPVHEAFFRGLLCWGQCFRRAGVLNRLPAHVLKCELGR